MRPGVNRTRQGNYHSKPRDLTVEDLRVMHLPRAYWEATREKIPVGSRAREALDNFCEKLVPIMEETLISTLLFHGDPFTGKTSCAAIVAKACRAHRYSVFFVDASTLVKGFVSNDLTEDEEHTARERAYLTDVLVIDDLGAGYETEFYVTEVAALLKHRTDHRKLTVVTTALGEGDLVAMLGSRYKSVVSEAEVIRCITDYTTGGSHE